MRYRLLTLLLTAALLSGCSQGTADAPEPAETTQAETSTQAETTTEAFVPPPAEYETADNSAEILAAAQEQTEQMRQRFGDDIPAFEPAELVTIIENPDEMTYSGIFEQGIQYGQKSYTYIIRDCMGNNIGKIKQPENEVIFEEAYVYDSDGHIIRDYVLRTDKMTVTTDTYENGILRHRISEHMELEDGELKPVLESCYDEHGNLLESYDFKDGTRKRRNFTENQYDENGRLICYKNFWDSSDSSEPSWTIRYEYDDEGNEVLNEMIYGPSRTTVQSEYFSFGSLQRETTLDYYENGDLANKSVIEYSYDDPDHVHQIVEYEQGKQTYKAIFKYKIIDNT